MWFAGMGDLVVRWLTVVARDYGRQASMDGVPPDAPQLLGLPPLRRGRHVLRGSPCCVARRVSAVDSGNVAAIEGLHDVVLGRWWKCCCVNN